MVDITEALAPASDQLNAIELVHPRTFTIAAGSRLGVRDGKKVAEIALVDFPRVWRPSKGMLDVLAKCWGTDAKEWVGRSVTLYNDPDVMFGKERVGGVRISHLSHIDSPRDVTIRAAGGARKRLWHVEPLTTTADNGAATPDIDAIDDVETLRAMWQSADAATRKRIEARVAALQQQPAPAAEPTFDDAEWIGGEQQ